MRQGQRKSKVQVKKALIEELGKASGIVTYACDKVGVSRVTFYNYYKADKKFAEQVDHVMEKQIDVVEAALLKRIKSEDTTAIIFYLKTKGRTRGYVEAVEHDHKRINVTIEDEIDYSKLSDSALEEIANAKKVKPVKS